MKPTKLTAKTRKEIAVQYGIHRNTLLRRLRKKGVKLPGGLILPAELKKIYDALGWPEPYKEGGQV